MQKCLSRPAMKESREACAWRAYHDACLRAYSQGKGWKKVGKHSKGETSRGPAPDEAKVERRRASPSSPDSADEKNLEKAIKVCPSA